MLLTQKFHSLQEIDSEFIPAIENLMHEQWMSFEAWKQSEAQSPADVAYIYWLFFGPTQNSPVGIAQVSLEKVDTDKILPWWMKLLKLLNKSLDNWKIARFQLAFGSDGPAIFDHRFNRSGQDKLMELVKEIEMREDVVALTLTSLTPSKHRPSWNDVHHESLYDWRILKPWERLHRSYQDYLESLPNDHKRRIQDAWKKLHKAAGVTLGDFPTLASRQELLQQCPGVDRELLSTLTGGLLTFQLNQQLLGLVHYREGQLGTLFIEPLPLEPQGAEVVTDSCYVQYALLKAHELHHIRKVIVMRQQHLFRLNGPEEMQFFEQQGFITRKIHEYSWSRSIYLK